MRGTFPKSSETFILEELLCLQRCGHHIRIYSNWQELANISDKIFAANLLSCATYPDLLLKMTHREKLRTLLNFIGRTTKQGYRLIFFRNLFLPRNLADEVAKTHASGFGVHGTFKIFSKLRVNCTIFFNAIRINNLSMARQIYLLNRQPFIPDHIHTPFMFQWDAEMTKQLIDMYPTASYSVTLRSRDIFFSPRDQHYVQLRKELIENADQVFAISCFNKAVFSERFALKAAIEVVHSSIDTNFFSRNHSIRRVENMIVSVARFVPKKGLEVLLDACGEMLTAGVDFRLLIIGSGPLKADLLMRVTALGLKRHVKIVGPLPHPMVRSALNSAAVFALPCVVANDGDRDMLPNSLKEAMAMELLVVTSGISGIEELVVDGVHGLHCLPDNVSSLAEKLTFALMNKNYARAAGKRGRQRVLESFDISREGEKFSRALERIFASRCKQSKSEHPIGL